MFLVVDARFKANKKYKLIYVFIFFAAIKKLSNLASEKKEFFFYQFIISLFDILCLFWFTDFDKRIRGIFPCRSPAFSQ